MSFNNTISTSIQIFVSIVLCFTIIFEASSQCMQIEVPFEYIPNRSELIVEGAYEEEVTYWNDQKDVIYTSYKIKIYKVLKGDIASDYVWILTKGGQVGNQLMVVEPEVKLGKDFVGVLMLNPTSVDGLSKLESNQYLAWGMDQSVFKYNIQTGNATNGFKTFSLKDNDLLPRITMLAGQEPIIKSPFNIMDHLPRIIDFTTANRTIMSFSPSSIIAGIDEVLTISGSNLGNSNDALFFRNANSTNSNAYVYCPPSNIVSWTNTQIEVRVPSGAGTGKILIQPISGSNQFSSTDVEIPYNISYFNSSPNNIVIRYVAETSTGNIEYQMNNNFAANTAAAASFNRAMDTWKCTTGINWVQGSNTSINANTNDNTSVIRWSNGDIVYPTIGQYGGFFFACSSSPSEYYAAEFDIVFLQNGSGVTWEYGPGNPSNSESDFETTALHELGHALICGHVSDDNEIMYPSSFAGTTNRIPSDIAIEAALFSMPKHQSNDIICSGYYGLSPIAPITVMNLNNSGAGSLRQAITEVCKDNDIQFASGLSGTLNLSGTPLSIPKSMNIVGSTTNQLIISGGNAIRMFDIEPSATLHLSNLSLINGYSTVNGGAFYNQGNVILENMTFQNNFQGAVQKAFSNSSSATTTIKGEVGIND